MRSASLLALASLLSVFLLLAGCALFPQGLPEPGAYPPQGRPIGSNSTEPPSLPANATPASNNTNGSGSPNLPNATDLNPPANASGQAGIVPLFNATNKSKTPLHYLAPQSLEMMFFNVGFADATLVRAGTTALLIDTGSADSADGLTRAMRVMGVSRIDALIVSSWTPDKAGGVGPVMRRFPTASAWHDNAPRAGELASDALAIFSRADIPVLTPEAGQTYYFGDLRVNVYNPQPVRYGNNPRSDSLALRIQYKKFCAFLPGDIEEEQEPQIVSQLNSTAPCPVFKWRYHGAGRPTPSILFDRLHPSDVVISTGPNDEHLPSFTTLTRINLSGARTWLTNQSGPLYLNTTGNLPGNFTFIRSPNLTAIGLWYNATYAGFEEE